MKQFSYTSLFAILLLVFTPVTSVTRAKNKTGCDPKLLTKKFYGLNFSPFLKHRDPRTGIKLSPEFITRSMKRIEPLTRWVRVFGMSGGLHQSGQIAHQLGLKIVLQAWIGRDLSANEQEIRLLIQQARAGHADLLIVGSEVLLRKDVSEAQLILYLSRVKRAVPHLKIGTAETYHEWLKRPKLINSVDIIYVNLYPFWNGVQVNKASRVLVQWYQTLKRLAGKKPIIIAETGWPSHGQKVGQAIPSITNATLYLNQILRWQQIQQVPTFLFSAYDEKWKESTHEQSVGGAWGLLDGDGKKKYSELCY